MSDELGKCLVELEASATGLMKLVVIMLATAGVAALFFWISFTETGNIGGRVILFVLALLFCLPSMLGVYGLTRGRNNALRVHERGIVVHERGEDRRVPWDEIESYSADAFLRIETKSDDAIVFGLGGVGAVDEVMAKLREEVVVRRSLPSVQAMVRDGDAVELGGFVLDAAGVTPPNSETALPWSAIRECTTTERVVGAGRLASPTTFVVLKTATETFEGAALVTSDRELLIAFCRATISATLAP